MDPRPLHERLVEESRLRNKLQLEDSPPSSLRRSARFKRADADASRSSNLVIEEEFFEEAVDDPYQMSPIHQLEGSEEGGEMLYYDSDVIEAYEEVVECYEEVGYEPAVVMVSPQYEEDDESVENDEDDGTRSPESGRQSWMSEEQADEGYRILRAAWEQDTDLAEAEEEEEARREYDEYMMERLAAEHKAELQAAAREARERHRQELREATAARAARQAEAVRKSEARRVEHALEQAEQEEQKAESALRTKQQRLYTMEMQQSAERLGQLQREKEQEDAIEELRGELREREKRLRELRGERETQEQMLVRQQEEVQKAIELAKAKKEARIKAAVDCDEHESSLAIRYSRLCAICHIQNPRRRAALVACGHMACVTCAEKMLEDARGNGESAFHCPFCRKPTTYIKMFEDVEDVEQMPGTSTQSSTKDQHTTRKRKDTAQQPSTSRKRFIIKCSRYPRNEVA